MPPVLVLDGIVCRPYLKIPNLFLPMGHRLHPPLRRDAVARLLASQPDQITWLIPKMKVRGFEVQSIADKSFRPMADWIDYVIDHESESLRAWVASHQFDFEHFVCTDEVERKQTKAPPTPPPVEAPVAPIDPSGKVPEITVTKKKIRKKKPKEKSRLAFTAPAAKGPDHEKLQIRLRELELQFQESDEPIDSPKRAEIWREMAVANADLDHHYDSAVCWVNALWSADEPPGPWVEQWLTCQQHGASVGKLPPEMLDDETLDAVLAAEAPGSSHPNLIAAYLVWASRLDSLPTFLSARRSELAQYLQKQEGFLPIRAAWLAWHAMYRMSGNDVLMLARARDRLLERLFRQGLTPEFDMAAFMRTGDAGVGDRFRTLRDQLVELHAAAIDWIVEPVIASNPQTKRYADLIFTYALARLGEEQRCKEMLERVGETLDGRDLIHRWAFHAFRLRIEQTLAGEATQGQLSEELLQELEMMDREDRYKLDRLRQRMRILEPHVRIDPYRNWHRRFADDLSRELTMLQNVVDGDELRTRIDAIMAKHRREWIRILPVALQLSPRVGEQFACSLLDKVPKTIDKCREAMDKALLLQRALHIAANYGHVHLVHQFVSSLIAALPAIFTQYLELESQNAEIKEKTEAAEALLTQSFRGLRKLGMRDEIGRMYGTVAKLVEKHSTRKAKSKAPRDRADQVSRSQRLLLCVAAGWYYFGENEQAQKITDRVRVLLKDGGLRPIDQKDLTCAYLGAVSQAPIDESLERVKQILAAGKLGSPTFPRIGDSMTTCSHFSISQLDVVEAAVLSLISEDFSISSEARRWLDEDEFLVRSRIHREMRQASGEK